MWFEEQNPLFGNSVLMPLSDSKQRWFVRLKSTKLWKSAFWWGSVNDMVGHNAFVRKYKLALVGSSSGDC